MKMGIWILKVSKEFRHEDEFLKSYDIAHYIGFNLLEEYELLCLFNELQRLEYIKRHLAKIIPLNVSMENLKEKIDKMVISKILKDLSLIFKTHCTLQLFIN